MGHVEMNQLLKYDTNVSRILVCGLGSIGRKHLRILRDNWKDLDIALLRSNQKQRCVEEELANHQFGSLEEAIKWGPHAAIIATPATDHLRKAVELAKHRIPILLEKPVGTGYESQDEWEYLLSLSRHSPVLVGYVLRHDPCGIFVKSLLDNKRLGKLIEADFYCGSWLPDWRPKQDYRQCVSARQDLGGGVLLELSHEIDLALWLIGELQVEAAVMGTSGLLEIDVEDQVSIIARTTTDAIVTIRLNFCTTPPCRRVIVRGSLGSLEWDIFNSTVQAGDEENSKPPLFSSPVSPEGRYHAQMSHFLACVAARETPACSLRDGLNVLDVISHVRKKNQILGRH